MSFSLMNAQFPSNNLTVHVTGKLTNLPHQAPTEITCLGWNKQTRWDENLHLRRNNGCWTLLQKMTLSTLHCIGDATYHELTMCSGGEDLPRSYFIKQCTRPILRIYALLAIYPIFPSSLRVLLQTRFSCTWLRTICIQCSSLHIGNFTARKQPWWKFRMTFLLTWTSGSWLSSFS